MHNITQLSHAPHAPSHPHSHPSPITQHPAPSTPQPWHLYRLIRRQSPTEAAPYSANYVPVGCQGEYPIRSVTQQVGSDARRGEGRHRRFLVRRGSAFTKCIHVKRGGFWNTAIQRGLRPSRITSRGGVLLWCAFVVRCYHAPIVIWQVSCASLGFMGTGGKGEGRAASPEVGGIDDVDQR